MNGFSEKTRIMYGTICIIGTQLKTENVVTCFSGYGIGLIVTFVALTLMSMAQPALIYLVPCTLFPVMGTAAIRKEFSRVWNGVSDEEAKPTVVRNIFPNNHRKNYFRVMHLQYNYPSHLLPITLSRWLFEGNSRTSQ